MKQYWNANETDKAMKIRDDDDGEWRPIKDHMQKRDGALMSHGMCPVCHAQMSKEMDSSG